MATKFLGTSDDVTTCECCGRSNLKSTVALSIDEGEAVYFGVTCAALALRSTVKEIKAGTRAADKAREQAEAAARDKVWRERTAPWFAFLAAHGKGDNVFSQIESLGGVARAKELFAAEG